MLQKLTIRPRRVGHRSVCHDPKLSSPVIFRALGTKPQHEWPRDAEHISNLHTLTPELMSAYAQGQKLLRLHVCFSKLIGSQHCHRLFQKGFMAEKRPRSPKSAISPPPTKRKVTSTTTSVSAVERGVAAKANFYRHCRVQLLQTCIEERPRAIAMASLG